MESELAPIKYLQDSHVYKDYTISVSIIKCEQVNNQPLSRQLIIWVYKLMGHCLAEFAYYNLLQRCRPNSLLCY